MATTRQVESADTRRTPKPRATFSEASDHEHVLANPRGTARLDALERSLAALHVRRLANRHGCDGKCDEPEHALDVAAMREALQALFAEPHARRKTH